MRKVKLKSLEGQIYTNTNLWTDQDIQIQYMTNTNLCTDQDFLVQVLENRAMQDEERMAKLEEELKEVYLFGIAITRQTR